MRWVVASILIDKLTIVQPSPTQNQRFFISTYMTCSWRKLIISKASVYRFNGNFTFCRVSSQKFKTVEHPTRRARKLN